MPELAEVEFYRRQWEPGVGARVLAAEIHAEKRIFRGQDTSALVQELPGVKFLGSEARGKQMAFRFGRGLWLGIHLGMTGALRVERAGHAAGKHDHLVLQQHQRALVFSDPRQFGRVLCFQGTAEPPWWAKIPPSLTSPAFTRSVLAAALERHARLPLKATLLLQQHFPGVGNWMADEILWLARLHPRVAGGSLDLRRQAQLWKAVRFVCRGALKYVSQDYADPPKGWFYHERWAAGGRCPRDGTALERATIGGRTTAWCARCQV